jgi:hypothetical protein
MDENALIMNHNPVATPEDSLTRMTGDNEELQYARAHHAYAVKQRLSKLDLGEISFFEPGTVEIKLMINGEPKTVNFSIKSISDDMMRKLSAPLLKMNAKIPTRYDPETKVRVHDETHPEYDEITSAFVEENRLFEFKKLLHGLDMKLEYGGRVLWNPYDEEEQDYRASIDRLNTIGIRTSDIKTIIQAIDKLSNKAIETDQEEFQKK